MNYKLILNIFKNAIDKKNFFIMVNKVKKRFIKDAGLISKEKNISWLRKNCSSFEDYAIKTDKELWKETKEACNRIRDEGEKKLKTITYDLGGGGHFYLLYFLVRKNKPKNIIETGVAAGFSSSAILNAIKKNKAGRLSSSDFPYFRLNNPEKYIGFVVDDSLKKDWNLHVKGDVNNIPEILTEIKKVDFLHYDSDKSYEGRDFVIKQVRLNQSEPFVLMLDDIQDNSHFHDLIKLNNISNWYIFEFEGKYIGLIENFN